MMTIEVNIDEILHVHQFLVGRVFLFLTSARESVPIRKSRYKPSTKITGLFGKRKVL